MIDLDEKKDKELIELIRLHGTTKCKTLLFKALSDIKTCTVKNCNENPYSTGMCKKHYGEMYRGFIDKEGNVLKEKYTHRNAGSCKLCNDKAISMQLCGHHYNQYYRGIIDRNGKIQKNPKKKEPIKRYTSCAISGCENKHHAKGFCSVHYKQIKRGIFLFKKVNEL